jgi:Uncharacterized protein conserved in bacteria
MNPGAVAAIIVTVVVLLVFSVLLLFLKRYKKCPSDKILVINGKISSNKEAQHRFAKCIHGGAAFVIPIIQDYAYLDLTPISISVDLKNALSRQNIRIDVPSRFTVGISTEPGVMQNAAERLLRLKLTEIQELAKDIIFGQLRLTVATMNIEEINTDRDKFLEQISRNVETELKKIGLRLINVNLTDISDESGYIVALGKEAAAKAINDAKISVAEADKHGSIGEAQARRDQRVNVSMADSDAIKGENEARAAIAFSKADLTEKESEAQRRAVVAQKVQSAKALEESYNAEREAELVRATRDKATQEADIIVKMEIEKRRKEIEAEAEAEMTRRRARGDADAIFAKMDAQARGAKAILMNQAEGIQSLVQAAGGDPSDAMRLMITDKLETLVKTQVEAIKNIKIDKITVWDNGAKGGETTSTANFLSNLLKSLPPISDLFESAGLSLPDIIKPNKIEEDETAGAVRKPPESD